MSHHAAGEQGARHPPTVGHVVSPRLLVAVLATLLVLTFVTVAVTWVDLGPFNLIAALAIATIKASLVLLYFMHLRWDSPFNAVVLISALILVMLFVGLSLLDGLSYEPTLIPDFGSSTAAAP